MQDGEFEEESGGIWKKLWASPSMKNNGTEAGRGSCAGGAAGSLKGPRDMGDFEAEQEVSSGGRVRWL